MGANSDITQCSKMHYSITSAARASSVDGTSSYRGGAIEHAPHSS